VRRRKRGRFGLGEGDSTWLCGTCIQGNGAATFGGCALWALLVIVLCGVALLVDVVTIGCTGGGIEVFPASYPLTSRRCDSAAWSSFASQVVSYCAHLAEQGDATNPPQAWMLIYAVHAEFVLAEPHSV
jgi:hypothetical protein